jgi:hypothetical protein
MNEANVHIAVVEYLDLVLPAGSIVFHPANGEYRDKRTAAKLRRMGVKPGIPDLVIVSCGGRVAFLEVKPEKGGQLSRPQRDFRDWCLTHSVPYGICLSIDDARAFLDRLGIETREVLS